MKPSWHKNINITIADKHTLRRSSADATTRYLHSVIPRWIQNKFRDLGGFKLFADVGANIMGIALMISNPSLLLKFLRVSYGIHIERFRPGDLDCYLEHCFVHDGNNDQSTEADRGTSPQRVLIFFHGGAWGSGSPWLYRLCAHNAAVNLNACRLILVGYPTFPVSSIEMQSECVIAAIGHIHVTGALNADTDLVYIVMGHSSGANICGLAVNKIVERRLHQCKVDYFIGLSGVYDVGQHYLWERDRGVHLISPMGSAASKQGFFENFSNCSPTMQLRRSFSFSEGSKLTNQYILKTKVMLLHGSHDCTVPVLSTLEYAESLRLHGIEVHTAYPEYDHMDPIVDLTLSTDRVTSDILKYFEKLITDDAAVVGVSSANQTEESLAI